MSTIQGEAEILLKGSSLADVVKYVVAREDLRELNDSDDEAVTIRTPGQVNVVVTAPTLLSPILRAA